MYHLRFTNNLNKIVLPRFHAINNQECQRLSVGFFKSKNGHFWINITARVMWLGIDMLIVSRNIYTKFHLKMFNVFWVMRYCWSFVTQCMRRQKLCWTHSITMLNYIPFLSLVTRPTLSDKQIKWKPNIQHFCLNLNIQEIHINILVPNSRF